MKCGTAPLLTTALVWSGVPEAMLVRAQADSNWRLGASKWARNSTSRGRIPRLIITSMGGFLSLDKIFLAA